MDTSTVELVRNAAQIHSPAWQCFVFGFAGGLLREIRTSKDGGLSLPKIKNGKLYLNCLVGALIGGGMGFLLNGSIITAFGWGVGGSELFDRFVNSREAA